MKVKELIAELEKFNSELYVEIRYINHCADEGAEEMTEDIEVIKLDKHTYSGKDVPFLTIGSDEDED